MIVPLRFARVVMVAILVAVLTGSKMAAAVEPVTLEDIQAIATRWRASFVNLRIVYETRGLPPRKESLIEWSAPENSTSAPLLRSVEWIWADHGLDLFDGRSFYWSPGKTGIRSIDGFNGPKNLSFRALYRRPPGEAETLVEVGMQRIGGKSTSWLNRAPMRGLYWANTAEWLPEVLARGEWVLEGIEPILGIPCAKLSTRYVRGKDTHVDFLWLDLVHDGLPRRYQRLANSERTVGSDFVVDEVQQLPEGIWFPKHARLQLQTEPVENQLIVVTEAAINIELDLSRFDPPAPVQGTLVSDGRIGRAYRFGVDPVPAEPILTNPPNDTSHTALMAKPDFWLNVSFAAICMTAFVSVLTLVIGVWLRVRTFLVVVAALVSAPSFPSPAAADEQVTLEHIQRIAARWRASFVNLRVVCELRSLPPRNEPLLNWKPPADPTSAPQFASEEWIWADHGLDLLDVRAFYWNAGKTGYRQLDVFNGPKNFSFRANYQKPAEGAEVLKHLGIRHVGGKPTSWQNRAAMSGLYWANVAEWLPEVLDTDKWDLEGVESILGARCAKLSTRHIHGKHTSSDILWLDLEHDGVPRRYQQLPNRQGGVGIDFVADEIEQLEDGFWFPKQARTQLQTEPVQNQLIVVTEAAINIELDLSRFDPPAPLKTTIVVDGRIGNPTSNPVNGTTDKMPSKKPTNNSHSTSDLEDHESPWTNWIYYLICISIASFSVGVFRKVNVDRR